MSTRVLSSVIALSVLLGAGPGCGGKKRAGDAPAAATGVVGQVLRVEGTATYTAADGRAVPLKAGDLIRAEWTLRTGKSSRLSLLLRNGHQVQLGEDLEKRAGALDALRQPPVKRGALDGLDAYGGPAEIDRATAAGTYQERTAGSRAFTSRPFTSGDKQDVRDTGVKLDEGRPKSADPTTDIAPPVVPGTDAVKSVEDLTRGASDLGRALARLTPFLKRCLLLQGVDATRTIALEIRGVTGKVDRVSVNGAVAPAGSCVHAVVAPAVFPTFPESTKLVTFDVTIP